MQFPRIYNIFNVIDCSFSKGLIALNETFWTFVLTVHCGEVDIFLADPDSPDVTQLEKEIDELVYRLYDLTQKEIAIVEKKK